MTTAPYAVQAGHRHGVRVLILAYAWMLGFYSVSWSSRLRKGTTIGAVAVMLSAPSCVVVDLALTSLSRGRKETVVQRPLSTSFTSHTTFPPRAAMALLDTRSLCSPAFWATPCSCSPTAAPVCWS
ncbi:uncharacterized protein LOC144108250 [Amblyomma americanum]